VRAVIDNSPQKSRQALMMFFNLVRLSSENKKGQVTAPAL
jgi:hypothetical protein